MLGMIESLLCGASAGRMTGKDLDSNQELIAQGIGNMLLPFFGGIPATAAIARTSVAIKSGAQTRLAGIFHALFLFLSMIILHRSCRKSQWLLLPVFYLLQAGGCTNGRPLEQCSSRKIGQRSFYS